MGVVAGEERGWRKRKLRVGSEGGESVRKAEETVREERGGGVKMLEEGGRVFQERASCGSEVKKSVGEGGGRGEGGGGKARGEVPLKEPKRGFGLHAVGVLVGDGE